nr:hypothetical protein [Collinsella aerofaciens]
MAPKNLLPVAALCSALASGMPLAAWATPATANSLPQALNPVTDSSGIVACQRFSLAHATIRTSGCLRRNTVDAIVVDIKRPNKENGPQTGYAICTWKSAAVDADGDPCDLELRIDIDSVDDSANGAKVAFDSAAYEEEGGGVCLGCVPSNVDGTQPIISFTASLRLTKADTEAIATGDVPLLFYAGDADDQEAQSNGQKGSLNLARGSEPAPINIDTQEPGVQRILADPALLQMTWHGVGSVGIAAPISSDNDKSPKDEIADAPAHVDDADDAPSEDNATAPLEKPGGTATELGNPQPKDGLDFAAPPDVDEGNCCMMVALDHTETVDAASIEPVAANAPRRKNILIAFPNTIELVFLPSGEVVAPTALTAVGARSASNDIQAISALDATTTAKLHLYSVAADGTRTEEFDGTKLLVPRRIGIQEDFPYQMELEGFDRARDADIIAAAIASPQHIMTLRFDFSPVLS